MEEFFEPGRDILIARDARDVASYLRDVTDQERIRIGARARERVLARHTSAHRAAELQAFMQEASGRS